MVNSIDILNSINDHRKANNLQPLQLNEIITQQANMHCENMANGSVPFSHDGFSNRLNEIKKQGLSFTRAGENVALTYPDQNPKLLWEKSDGHNKNMLGNFNLCGIGHAINSRGIHYYCLLLIYHQNILNNDEEIAVEYFLYDFIEDINNNIVNKDNNKDDGKNYYEQLIKKNSDDVTNEDIYDDFLNNTLNDLLIDID